jgi:hypothetical protein
VNDPALPNAIFVSGTSDAEITPHPHLTIEGLKQEAVRGDAFNDATPAACSDGVAACGKLLELAFVPALCAPNHGDTPRVVPVLPQA